MAIQVITRNKTNNITYLSNGKWFDTDSISGEYKVNLSDIFTVLVKQAGLHCENYADDLFDLWQEVKQDLKNYNFKGKKYAFGFKSFGVDNAKQITERCAVGGQSIYKSVWILSVEVERLKYCENRIKAVLERVC